MKQIADIPMTSFETITGIASTLEGSINETQGTLELPANGFSPTKNDSMDVDMILNRVVDQ